MSENLDNAPHPWKIEDHGSNRFGYLRIVDATGKTICDFFPHAGKDGRGCEAAFSLAEEIISAVNWCRGKDEL